MTPHDPIDHVDFSPGTDVQVTRIELDEYRALLVCKRNLIRADPLGSHDRVLLDAETGTRYVLSGDSAD